MTLPYELFIAIRYLRARRKQVVISVITVIAILSILFGVMSLVIALALMTGVREDAQNKILEGTAHINILRKDNTPIDDYQSLVRKVEALPHVRAAAATTYQQALAQSQTRSAGIILKGVDPSARRDANEVFRTLVEGSAESLIAADTGSAHEDTIVLGISLAQDLSVSVGGTVTIISTEGRLTPAGLAPRIRTLRIAGIFKSGLHEYDSSWGYVSLASLRKLIGSSNVADVVQVKVDDIYAVKSISSEILRSIGGEYATKDWQELNQPIFAALSIQKGASLVFFLLVIGLGALNIITTLVMMVMEKARDIAILVSMGATRRGIMKIFLWQGLILGLLGTVFGTVLGVMFSWYANRSRLISFSNEDIFYLSYLPFRVLPSDVLLVVLASMSIALLAAWYPAWRASRYDPVEGLRYE